MPYQLPPFAEVSVEHFGPAFEAGMADQLREIDAIVSNPDSPTFANTVEALERSGGLLKRTSKTFFTLASSDATDAIRALETEISPRLTHHQDSIHLNRDLYARLSQVTSDDAEEVWLLDKYLEDFTRAGANLAAPDQDRLRLINEELTTLATEFTQNLLKAATASALVVDDRTLLDGLSEDTIENLRRDGDYVLPLLNYTTQPALAELTNREVRRRLFELSVGRAPENLDLAVRMAGLRAQRAALLGYPNHAAYAVANQTAATTDAVEGLLSRLVGPAVDNARREAKALSRVAGFDIEPWDWPFYAEQVRQADFHFDSLQLRPYLELDRVLHDGIFYAAGELYGLSFAERDDLTGYHPDVRVFEVFEADGSPLGLFLLDPYARPTKKGGAWMNALVDQSFLFDEASVVVNNLNVTKPPHGPTLLTLDEVETAFHEFGHALHGLFSAVRFPRVAGTAVPRDFVEYPSQVNEMWVLWPSVLSNFARHHESGEPVPAELLEQLTAAATFNQGFKTLEYLAATVIDWAWHTLGPDQVVDDPVAFEAEALEQAGIPAGPVPPRYRTNYFAHSFSTGVAGYSAGYYAYIWSEVLDADSVEWFKENGGLSRANGDRFRAKLLSVGGSKDVISAFVDFRGRDARIEPLLERRGLAS